MDTLGLYAVIGVAAIVIAVGMRFVVYTVLVKNNGILPEKATKAANTTSVAVLVVAVAAMVVNAMISNHPAH